MNNVQEIRTDLNIYNFKEVIGNVTSVGLIQKALVRKRFPKLAVMSGVPGTGKSTCADIAGMAITCDNPQNGNPCLECKSCKENLRALATTGQSKNLIKKNLGKLKTKKDVADILNEIFVLQSPIGMNVYELGEAHCWSAEDQSALLEEIDRLDANTVIIITTTKTSQLIPELRSRAINFNFGRLNKTECKLLFDRTCAKLGVGKVSAEQEQMIIKYSRGIPRDMTNIISFIKDVEPSVEEIKSFLNVIDYSLFTELLEAMSIGLKDSVILIDYMLNTYSVDMVVEQFKNYFVDVLFFMTGELQGGLNKDNCERVKKILTVDTAYKISKLVQEMIVFRTDEANVRIQFVKIRQALVNKKVGHILAENSKNASSQDVKAQRLYSESKSISEESKKASSEQLDKNKLFSMLQVDNGNKNNNAKPNNQPKDSATDKQPLEKGSSKEPNNSKSEETKDMNLF